jgi:hypothetical protein
MPFFEDIAVGIAKNLTISAARPLLLALLGAQDDQLKKLSTIQQDVRRLLEGPWRQARVLVAEAAETRDDDPQRMVYLDEPAKRCSLRTVTSQTYTQPVQRLRPSWRW